ncbi:MAG: sulfatase-like hydrolase/transferase [Rikenellaceae bacterium]|jgi:arylsulfatase A-like enzyme|nr:sulfatase-like hydrolase/transferase [Rikenellaceae bacterium]
MKCPLLTALVALGAAGQATAQNSRPNVLVLLVDDMQMGAIHAFGGQAATPNIDALASNGVGFTRCHTNGAIGGALSQPSRAMIMTGRHLFELQADGAVIPEAHVTMPKHFHDNGYATFATGKWHSDRASFNRTFAAAENIFFGGMHQYNLGGQTAPRLHHFDPSGRYDTPFIGNEFSSKMFADAAIGFIDTARHASAPWFVYVAFTSPHDPRNVRPDYAPGYQADGIRLPPNFVPQHPFDNGDMTVRDEALIPPPHTPDTVRQELAYYYQMVSEVDVQIGRIVDKLHRTGTLDNTIIVFASDNGLAMGQHGLMGKQNVYEHSMGVPMIVCGPGVKRGVRSEACCYLSDVFPTLCDMVGIDAPNSVTAISLASALRGEKAGRETLLLAYSSIQRAVIHNGWKYVIYNVEGVITEQLFDLAADPWEAHSHAADPRHAARKAEYRELLRQQMKLHGDFCNLDNPRWWSKGGKITGKDIQVLFL